MCIPQSARLPSCTLLSSPSFGRQATTAKVLIARIKGRAQAKERLQAARVTQSVRFVSPQVFNPEPLTLLSRVLPLGGSR
jgi:hypothetical protein